MKAIFGKAAVARFRTIFMTSLFYYSSEFFSIALGTVIGRRESRVLRCDVVIGGAPFFATVS